MDESHSEVQNILHIRSSLIRSIKGKLWKQSDPAREEMIKPSPISVDQNFALIQITSKSKRNGLMTKEFTVIFLFGMLHGIYFSMKAKKRSDTLSG